MENTGKFTYLREYLLPEGADQTAFELEKMRILHGVATLLEDILSDVRVFTPDGKWLCIGVFGREYSGDGDDIQIVRTLDYIVNTWQFTGSKTSCDMG